MEEELKIDVGKEEISLTKKKTKKEKPENISYLEHKMKMTKAILISVASSIAAGGLTTGLIVYSHYKKYDDPNIKKLVETYEIMVDDWYFSDDETATNVTDAALTAMTDQGDQFTFYTTSTEDQGLSTVTNGLGFRYTYYGGDFLVKNVIKNSPADQAGLKENDVITKSYINDNWVTFQDCSYYDALAAIKNTDSVTKKYMVTRLEDQITITAQNYSNPGAYLISDTLTSDDKLIVTVRIDTFLDKSIASKVELILDAVTGQYNHSIDQLNIDLRDNGGGYVDSAVDLLGLFVPKGTTVLQYLYKDGTTSNIKTNRIPTYSNLTNFNIFQNSNTASASETFTLAMRYLKNARVIGSTSYGKGIVQSLKYFEDGSVLRYTMAKSQFPINSTEAICIHGVGITPSENYNFNNVFYYFGEEDFSKYDEETYLLAQEIIIDEVNMVLNPDNKYLTYSDALTGYQTNKGLTITGSMNKETGRLLQKELYDLYMQAITEIENSYIA